MLSMEYWRLPQLHRADRLLTSAHNADKVVNTCVESAVRKVEARAERKRNDSITTIGRFYI